MASVPVIAPWQLGVALVFIAGAGAASVWLKLGLGKQLLVGVVRTFLQLFLLGYALVYIFRVNSPWLVVGGFLVMVVFAARIVSGRLNAPQLRVFNPIFLSMLLSYGVISYLVVGVVVGAQPWWNPKFFLPLAGMVVGNSMNAIALALERLLGEVENRRAEIECWLMLGAEPTEATASIFAASVRAGMIPSINAMMGVGVVFIPGMMSGQILAGVDPTLAIRYQIVVMLMLVGSTTLGSTMGVWLIRRRLFGPGWQLLWPREGA